MEVAAELGVPMYEWSVTAGLAKCHGAPLYNTDQPEQALANIPLIPGDAIFLLKDFGRYCENDRICRRLRDLAEKFRIARRAIVISAPSLQSAGGACLRSGAFQLDLPTPEELLPGVKGVLAERESRAAPSCGAGPRGNRPTRSKPCGAFRRRSDAHAADVRDVAGMCGCRIAG